MCPGLANPDDPDDCRKTAVIDRELDRLNISIAALQETRLSSSGSIREASYTFFWKGKDPEEPRIHGVGFAVKHNLLQSIEPIADGSERLLALKMQTQGGRLTIVSAYAPTLDSPEDTKDLFYHSLDSLLSGIPTSESVLVLGDFNARVGADQEAWPRILGHFGVGKMNSNGQRLLELCAAQCLCITNTFFNVKTQHKVTWCHPRSKRWHQLDLALARRSALNETLSTRSYHSADCDTDHSAVHSCEAVPPKAAPLPPQRPTAHQYKEVYHRL